MRRFQRHHQPTISVDTKKKELVGDFKNPGREWRPQGSPAPVRVHDFLLPERGKAIPYGVYDLSRNEGWISVGIDHDTASFAVKAISRWWKVMGRPAHPKATSLLITADAGGSNGPRVRLWKRELQDFANRTGLRVRSELDRGTYPMGVVVTDQQMARIKLVPHPFHGDWNYTIRPNRRKRL